ncbi:MAG TPA: type II toxin-antitoxin system VapC family toxin [Acetobacteraceae bacterium]|nr:type II toxin-antitoxin system VapC family toxin [Acetobacteraceae bacterium]
MDLLLDTQVFLWWDRQDPALRGQVQAVIADPANRVYVGAASLWEAAIKRRLGKLEFDGSPTSAIAANGFHELPIRAADAESAGDLSWRHNDPFDRLLVAQARPLTITLVTADRTVRAFDGVAQLWAG